MFLNNTTLTVDDHPPGLKLIWVVASSVIINCSSVTGFMYIWIILSIAFSRSLWGESNFFLLSLLITEFLCGCHVLVFFLHHKFPRVLSHAIACSTVTFLCGYFLNSVVVTADRYYKIAKPLKYMRLMNKKLCARIILTVWGVMVLLFIFTIAVSWDHFQQETYLDIFDTPVIKIMTFILEFVAVPCLIAIVVFVIALVKLARNQQRRVDAERVMLGNIGNKPGDQTNNQADKKPKRAVTKSMRYTTVYFATIIIAWVPTVIFIMIGNLDLVETLPFGFHIAFYIVSAISVIQMIFGALFLTYIQKEHKLVLSNARKKILNAVRCRCTTR
ncbi:uncharacterized protein [Asterias amurensis]|uniref:uncharacterized protein n=1 Tax=Asterias amurensis TaxID=7602 RepID=UPI003AB859FF